MTFSQNAPALRSRLVRYGDLIPCTTAFIDARTPGSDRKENFTIIGPGVAENPDQFVHIDEPHGFNIGGARQPPGCVNSQHFHETAEVFLVHTGRWVFRTGEHADEGEVVLEAGDVISIPTHIFRGFENVGDDLGFLYAMLGGDDPGRVVWAPDVLKKAEGHGLLLMQSGRLVDTLNGEAPGPIDRIVQPESREALARVVVHATSAELERSVVRRTAVVPEVPVRNSPGVQEGVILGGANAPEAAPAAALDWPHGFVCRRRIFTSGAVMETHTRSGVEVIFLETGLALVDVDGEIIPMGPGDTLSIPRGASRCFTAGPEGATMFVTLGGDHPEPANFDRR